MRLLLALGALVLVGGVLTACLFWAGVTVAGPIAFALGGALLAIVAPLVIGQLGSWGVPGDEPPIAWRSHH